MSELTRTGNKFKWTIPNFGFYSIDSVKFTLDGYEDITWHLSHRCSQKSLNRWSTEETFQFYLVRDQEEDDCRWAVHVDYRIEVSGFDLKVNVANFYPKKKYEIDYLKPAQTSRARPESVVVSVDILNVDIIKTGWPNVCTSITKLLVDGIFSDVTIVVGDEQFKAHKVVLSAHSPVFESMFTQEMVEKQTNRVEIDDISADIFKAFLQYIYLGSFDEITEFCEPLIQVANKYQVETLKADCEEHLIRTISIDNCLELFKTGDLLGSKKLVDAAIEFINKHRADWDQNEDFKEFLLKHPEFMMMLLLPKSKK